MAEPTRPELDEQARALGIDPEQYETKQELQDAIDDAPAAPTLEDDGSDESGRPPLHEVAEDSADPDQHPRVREVTTPKEGDR